MCGIAGFVTERSPGPERRHLDAMADVIRHRGPDDVGVWMERTDRVSVGLAHRRLAIIDLSAAGHQPMTNEDGSLWLIYNGEIYNHAEVRKELVARGHQYRSQTDSETILHAYEEWGDECVHRFRGMFAFAIWDRVKRRLFVARDRLGVKPLYYATGPGFLVFGSEIKALLASGMFPTRAASRMIPEYLMFGYLAGEETMFEGVRKLMPGHVLVWENGHVSTRKYWELRVLPNRQASEGDRVAEFRSLFEESVKMRLMSDVPLGVFLSGGLDSSAIAAVMSRHVSGRLKTFSVGFPSEHYSEFDFARTVAKHIGSEHHEIVLTADAFLEQLPRMIWHEDEPLWAPPSIALHAVSHLASQSVKVVLTGEGSDELFAGYDRYWFNAMNRRALAVYRFVPPPLRNLVRQALVNGPLPERLRRGISHTFFNHQSELEGLVLDNWFSVFTPDMQQSLLGDALRPALAARDVRTSHRAIWDRTKGLDYIDRMLYLDVHSNLVELLMKQDQASMATSIESRVPFLDHKLVEWSATVPVSMKLASRTGKMIVKKALSSYLPEAILHRPKKGFPVPFDDWLRHRFLPQIRETLLDSRARQRGWLNPEIVKTLLDGHAAGTINASRRLWSLWGLELWARIFLDGDGAGLGAGLDGDSAGRFAQPTPGAAEPARRPAVR